MYFFHSPYIYAALTCIVLCSWLVSIILRMRRGAFGGAAAKVCFPIFVTFAFTQM